jgi:hypothetical protein
MPAAKMRITDGTDDWALRGVLADELRSGSCGKVSASLVGAVIASPEQGNLTMQEGFLTI